MTADTFMASPDKLVKGFYNSFEDEEEFRGSEETIEWARAIVDYGDAMWNWPSAVEDAEAYIAANA
jgi:hypothetical protein